MTIGRSLLRSPPRLLSGPVQRARETRVNAFCAVRCGRVSSPKRTQRSNRLSASEDDARTPFEKDEETGGENHPDREDPTESKVQTHESEQDNHYGCPGLVSCRCDRPPPLPLRPCHSLESLTPPVVKKRAHDSVQE